MNFTNLEKPSKKTNKLDIKVEVLTEESNQELIQDMTDVKSSVGKGYPDYSFY